MGNDPKQRTQAQQPTVPVLFPLGGRQERRAVIAPPSGSSFSERERDSRNEIKFSAGSNPLEEVVSNVLGGSKKGFVNRYTIRIT
jgi:hypothetical protein